MRILLVASSFNSLTQRVLVELGDRGHTVPVEVTPTGLPCARPWRATRPTWSWPPC